MRKNGLLISILLVATLVLTAGCSEDGDDDDGAGEPIILTIAWKVSVRGDDYLIEIVDVKPEPLEDVSWELQTGERLIAEWDDPDGVNLRMDGGLDDVNYSQEDYDDANQSYAVFYSRNPASASNRNQTLCIVFIDVDENGMFNAGDSIWIRSVGNGGTADEGYYFGLLNERKHGTYGKMLLPAH